MKTAIVYYSEHHGNTQKLLDAIAAKHDVDLVNITATPAAEPMMRRLPPVPAQ